MHESTSITVKGDLLQVESFENSYH